MLKVLLEYRGCRDHYLGGLVQLELQGIANDQHILEKLEHDKARNSARYDLITYLELLCSRLREC